MNRKREALQAYFAGLFDGEGTVGIYNFNGDCYKAVAQIQMDDPRVGLIHNEYPEAVLSTGTTNPRRYWRVVFNGNNAYRFLKEIKPYCIVKHEQVKVALSFLVAQRRWRAGDLTKDEYLARSSYLASTIKSLKKPDDNAVNSVNLLLNHELREYRAKRADVEADVAALRERVETRLK